MHSLATGSTAQYFHNSDPMQSLIHGNRGDKNSTQHQTNGYGQMNGALINNFDIKVEVWIFI